MRLIFCFLLALCAAASARAQEESGPPRVGAPPWQTIELGPRAHRYPFPIYASRTLTPDKLARVEHVVIIIHGVNRDADHYYETAAGLLWLNPTALDNTLVIAPKFAGTIDRGFAQMPAWYRQHWIAGGDSVKAAGRPAPVGSFDVLDNLLEWLADRHELPTLRDVVLAGHSAGAQMIQRYAVLNDIDETLHKNGIAVRYVVANPSSYLFSARIGHAVMAASAPTTPACARISMITATDWTTCHTICVPTISINWRRVTRIATLCIYWAMRTTTRNIAGWISAAARKHKAPRGWRADALICATKRGCPRLSKTRIRLTKLSESAITSAACSVRNAAHVRYSAQVPKPRQARRAAWPHA